VSLFSLAPNAETISRLDANIPRKLTRTKSIPRQLTEKPSIKKLPEPLVALFQGGQDKINDTDALSKRMLVASCCLNISIMTMKLQKEGIS